MAVFEAIENVDGPDTFLEFVRELVKDREGESGHPIDPCGRGVNGWENHTIEGFLAAGSAWAEATDFGETQGLVGASPWKKLAHFLWCGKIYE